MRIFVRCLLFAAIVAGTELSLEAAETRPNFLWISCEDISPNLGCYGDPIARTPNLDRLASEGVRFDLAFTPAGVCAVVRSGLITGMYPVAIGTHHMRSHVLLPPTVRCFPEYLRAAGYFCTNRSKTDYQFPSPLTTWDRQGGGHRDWAERAEGQPFFSVINLTGTHESQIRHGKKRHQQVLADLPPEHRHDPERAARTLPPYLPDTPASRQDWAWYHDNISDLDRRVGDILRRLETDGLAESTIVVFWGDHGMGMPRGKRWIYDSGTRVPLIVRWPGHLGPGAVRDDLVSLLDLPPTMLSLAGVPVPPYMHGRVLFGPERKPEPEFLYFHRDRMDEAYELMRGIRDRRYKYLRNFEPEKPYAQGIDYMDEMPTMKDWRRGNADGTLDDLQRTWFQVPKPIEELYDTQTDPYETVDLATDPAHSEVLKRMRAALEDWQIGIGDLGMIPEPVLMERMRPGGRLPIVETPVLTVRHAEDGVELVAKCATPGASIGYRRAGDPAGVWRLYVGPIDVSADETIEAIGCRPGYRNSDRTTTKLKSP